MARLPRLPRIRSPFSRQMAGQPTIQTGNVAQKLIQALGIHGKVAAPSLGDLVHPVVLVEDLTRASWYAQGVDRPAAGANVLTPTVGQFQAWALCNLPGSGVVALIEEVGFWNATVTNVFVSLSQTMPGTASPTVFFRDTQLLNAAAPALVMRSDSLAAPGSGLLLRAGNTSTTNIQYLERPNLVLGPGWCLRVDSQTVSQSLGVHFKWRERFIEG